MHLQFIGFFYYLLSIFRDIKVWSLLSPSVRFAPTGITSIVNGKWELV